MSLTKEDIIKGLKEVTRKLEEGDEIDSSTMGIVEKFLKNFPPPTTRSVRNLSEFLAELLQLIISTYLFVTSSLLCWCARGGKVLLITQSCGRTNNYRDEASRMGDGTFDRVHKIREVSSSDFLSETLTCVCLGATVRLWNSCYGLHAPVRFAYRYCIFRCSLPKAMSISRSEI